MKRNGAYKRRKNNRHEKNGVILSGVLIQLTGSKTKKHYPKPVRKIRYYDREYRHTYEFITNDMETGVQEIADIYKRRWQVELLFKWIKQNLKIKSFWGTSENAVFCPDELHDDAVDWSQEERAVKHGNRWNTYIKFSDRFRVKDCPDFPTKEEFKEAWKTVIELYPRTKYNLQDLNTQPLFATERQNSTFSDFCIKHAGEYFKWASYLQALRRADTYNAMYEKTYRAVLKEATEKGAVTTTGDLAGDMKDITVYVNGDFEERFWDSRAECLGLADFRERVGKSLQIYSFTKLFLSGEKITEGEISDENCKPKPASLLSTSESAASGLLFFRDTRSVELGRDITNKPIEWTQFETVNPVFLNVTDDHLTPRSNDNVAELKALVFEMDDTPLEKQLELAEVSPAYRAVFSGSKSVHCKVALKNEAASVVEYCYWWQRINDEHFEGRADAACKDPCRLTRCPESTNAKTAKKAELLWERDVSYDNDPEDYALHVRTRAIVESLKKIPAVPATDDRPWRKKLERVKTPAGIAARDWVTMGDGHRHEKMWEVIGLCKALGATEEECVEFMQSNGIRESMKHAVSLIYRLEGKKL
jgi:hypothetical protein